MARFWGLKGRGLHGAVWAEACVLVAIFGYNQAAAGGVLTQENFNRQFPSMDVIDTEGAQKKYNSTIQGWSTSFSQYLLLTPSRHCHRPLHTRRYTWCLGLYLLG